jgi:hypothetical protein
VTGNASPEKSEDSPARTWRWWLGRIALGALALVIVVGVPYLWHLDKQVRNEFAQLQWQVPTRVYARPLTLSPGLRLDGDALEIELALAAYRKDGVGPMSCWPVAKFRRSEARRPDCGWIARVSIRRALPPSTATARKNAGWCAWTKCRSC